MSIAKIQSGDTVKVIAGNFKGTVGLVTKVIHKEYPKGKNKSIIKTRAAVDSIKKITKYRKSTVYQGQKYAGSMNQIDRFVDISNLMVLDESGKPARVKIVEKEGKKVRTFQTTGTPLVKKIIPKIKKTSENDLALESTDNILELEAKAKKPKIEKNEDPEKAVKKAKTETSKDSKETSKNIEKDEKTNSAESL